MSSVAAAVSRAFAAAWDVIDAAVADGHLPSAVLAIGSRDEILKLRTSGSGAITPTEDSIFLLASVTKPIAATGVLQLVERGKILLHEPIANHWPEFAINHKESVTLWHLLTHTSGLDESYSERPSAAVDGASLRAVDAARACETYLSFEPGTRYRYCNASFRVMMTLVERLTGQDYVEYLRANVLVPSGMVDTTFRPGDDQASRVVPALDLPFALEPFLALAHPAAGYWSTAADLIAFGQTYLAGGRGRHGRVLGPTMARAAARVHYEGVEESDAIRPNTLQRGLGFRVYGTSRIELVPPGSYGHGGATGTLLLIDPTHDLVLVFLTNRWGQDNRWRDRAINAFYGELADESGG